MPTTKNCDKKHMENLPPNSIDSEISNKVDKIDPAPSNRTSWRHEPCSFGERGDTTLLPIMRQVALAMMGKGGPRGTIPCFEIARIMSFLIITLMIMKYLSSLYMLRKQLILKQEDVSH